MATIGGLSSGTSSGVSMYGASMRGFGGLASGLDTDSLIEGMTLGTRTKIQQALKKKTTYQWQMDAYRSITDKLIGFSQKYLDIGNANSPFRASFFDKTLASPSGANSKYLSVSGTSTALDSMSVTGIKQLAKDASLTTSNNGSSQVLTTGDITFGDKITSKLDGGKMVINYDGVAYDVNLADSVVIENPDGSFSKQDLKYNTPQEAIDSINKLMSQIKLKDADGNVTNARLSEKVNISTKSVDVTQDDGTTVAENRFALNYTDTDDKKVYIGGGSEATLKALGFMKSNGELVNRGMVEENTALVGEAKAENIENKRNFGDFMAGKQITFSYNGVTKSIKLPANKSPNDPTQPNEIFSNADKFADYLNKELGSAFGSGRIEVKADGDALSFETKDKSSVFKITDADKDIMGEKGVFGIGYATTNRLNRETSLAKSGLSGLPEGFGLQEFDPTTGKMKYAATYTVVDAAGNTTSKPTGLGTLYDADGKLLIKINGKDVEGLTVNSSLLQVTSAINASDAGVKVSYMETADRFSISATDSGSAGKVEFGAAGNTGEATDFLSTLFGVKSDGTSGAGDFERTKGQDAIMTVKYEGNVEMDITRNSNSFNLDGATFNLTGTFGYEAKKDGNGNVETDNEGKVVYDKVANTEEVSFTTAVDADKVTKVIKEMIDDYNKVLAETFGQVSTKPDRDYGPLTDDEKGQLNTDEIKKLEDKAKDGILFNDPLLRSLSDQLRSAFSGVTDTGTLEKMGISLSSDYSANGKITFNEEKFKNALMEDPQKVKELFTKPAVKDANGDVITQGGFSVRLKSITDSFAKKDGIPKGSLVEKAGTTLSSTAINQNSLKTLMDEIDKQVDTLKDRLQVEIDRYTKQFSTLEQLVSQMNAQSSWLSSALGG